MNDCVFCKIVKGEIQTDKEVDMERIVVFADANPKTRLHLLIVPKKHITDITDDSEGIWAEIGEVAKNLAISHSLSGFRLVHNAGDAAEVKHMHVHFLGGVEVEREI
ncbi:MAG: HIT domain-containing protein [Patescibacteria group bacterium]